MGSNKVRSQRAEKPKSKFLAYAFAVLTACCIVMLAAMLGFLSMINHVNEQMRNVLVESLDNEINIVSAETSFSGTLNNISDELLNNDVLVTLGSRTSLEPDAELSDAQGLLEEVVNRTQGAGGARYFYFAASDYVLDANREDENLRGSLAAPVEAILDELQTASNRIVGSYENHVGHSDGANYQLMVRTVAPGVYYIVYFSDFSVDLPAGFAGFSDVQMYYYDRFGNSVACSELDDLLGTYDYASLGDNDTGVVYCRQNGKNYMGVYCTSHSRNVRLAIFFLDDMTAMRETATAVSALMALVVLANLAITIALIRRFYRPVRMLAQRVEQSASISGHINRDGTLPDLEGASRLRDDSAVIAEALDAYETQLERQQDLLSDTWLCRLLCDDDPDVLSEYEDAWIGRLQGRPYTVAVVRSDAPPCKPPLEHLVRSRLEKDFDCRFVSISHQVVVIVSLAGTSEECLVACLKQIQGDHSERELSAFIGRPRSLIEDISSCFNEAMSAAEHCLAREIYCVVEQYEDIASIQEDCDIELESMKRLPRLVRRICALDSDGALAIFDETVDLMKKEGGQTGGSNRDEFRLDLLTSSTALALQTLVDESAGVSDESTRTDLQSRIGQVRASKNPAQVRRQLAAALRCLASGSEPASGQRLFDDIKEATQANYRDASLSAGSLARQAGVSQSQVTKLFKKYNGTTFLEYLHNLRLSEATTLLLDTGLTENEIAQRVGYNNTVTMIRAFKKYRGIVPSSLRKR